MRPIKKRLHVLPENIHLLRGSNWIYLQKLEAKEGDAIRIAKGIRKIIELQKRRVADPKMVSNRAKGLINLFAQMTDEVLVREREATGKERQWNEVYVDCLLHYWKIVPHELRKEIIRLTPKK